MGRAPSVIWSFKGSGATMKAIVAISLSSLLLLLDADSGQVQRSPNLWPCTGAYVAGDCDHNGSSGELGDVIAMIALYRGTLIPQYPCECPPHSDEFVPEADGDGSCIALELSDVIAIIADYRGLAPVSYCPDCPPTE